MPLGMHWKLGGQNSKKTTIFKKMGTRPPPPAPMLAPPLFAIQKLSEIAEWK